MAPAASIATWILQRRPELAARQELRLLVINADEFEALDCGRWLRFIPWFLGRPALTLDVTIAAVPQPDAAPTSAAEAQTCVEDKLRSVVARFVQNKAAAKLLLAGMPEWNSLHRSGAVATPDLCVQFSPSLLSTAQVLLTEEGIWPLLRERVPFGVFSTSEADRAIDVHVLETAGVVLHDRDDWEPNPWALPNFMSARAGAHANLAWSLDATSLATSPHDVGPAVAAMEEMLELVQEDLNEHGVEALLTLGEPLRTADGKTLVRLPKGLAVDENSAQLFQMQDGLAFEVQPAFHVPSATLTTVPGHDRLLERAVWATELYRDHLAPYVEQHPLPLEGTTTSETRAHTRTARARAPL